MTISIVRDDEKLVYEDGESKIFYRRIPDTKIAFFQKKFTKRGKPDWGLITKAILEYIVTGWEKVKDGSKNIPFDTELVVQLPGDVTSELLELSGANDDARRERKVKN